MSKTEGDKNTPSVFWAMASGTMKRQNGHFIRVESTMNLTEREP
jgi:hypothetical protein